MSFLRAVTFLYLRTIANRVLRLVRHPKYLIFAALGVVAFGNRIFFGVVAPLQHAQKKPGLSASTEHALSGGTLLLVAAGVFLYVVALWVFGSEEASLQFTEPEVRFLFPAPVSRAALLRYKIAQTLSGSVFGALVLTVLGGRGRHPAIFALGFFLGLATLALHRIGASFARASLAGRGASTKTRRVVTLLVAATLAAAFLGAFVTTATTLPRLDDDPSRWLAQLGDWSNEHAATLSWVLLPLTAPARVMFAGSFSELVRALPPALLLVAAHYVWVMSSVVEFEEAAAAAAEARARTAERGRSGSKRLPRAGTRLFPLAQAGAPWLAIFWKNLVASGITKRTGVAMGALLVASVAASATLGRAWAFGVGIPLAGGAVLVAIFGPVGTRSDLRADLENLDLLRSYPLSARDVVKGSVLAPFCVLTGWSLCLLFAGALSCVRELADAHLETLLAATAGAALFLPALIAFGLLVQSVLTISFPALTTTDTSARGLEVSGQRMVALLVMVLVVTVTLLPAGLVAFAIVLLGKPLLGAATWLVAGGVAALVVAGECVPALALAARAFAELDVTERAS